MGGAVVSALPLAPPRCPRAGTAGLVLVLLLSGCSLYAPARSDCAITCSTDGVCPDQTVCVDGFCRLLGATSRCDCRAGETRPCGSSQGACEPGVQACVGTEWGACQGGVGPGFETCNGLDDDCNGQVDDVALRPSCALDRGVCAGATRRCVEGSWSACSSLDYGPDYEPVEQRCDGRDNDCDGLTDERPAVPLAAGARARWELLSTTGGFALAHDTGGGVTVRWLTAALSEERTVNVPGPLLAATGVDDAVVLASGSDAGVLLTRLERGGGTSARLVERWRDADAVQLGGGRAVARVAGAVELLDEDGGVRFAGVDVDGSLRLSHRGEYLSWSGALARTSDLSRVQDLGVPRLLALLEQEGGALAGVLPLASPAAQASAIPDLLSDLTPRELALTPVPLLSSLSASPHRGWFLVHGLATGTQGGLVVIDPLRGSTWRGAPGADSVGVAGSDRPFAALAWRVDGGISAALRCGP